MLALECNRLNQYSLYTLASTADYFAAVCQSRDFSGPLSQLFPERVKAISFRSKEFSP